MPSRVPAAITTLRRNLNDSLFKSAPESSSRLRRGELGTVLVALFLLAIVLQLLRIGPGNALDSVWAEDGPIYLQGAIEHGFWTDLWTTYAGYLVVVPRLVATAAHLLPLRDAAAAIAILSAFVVALSGFVVWVASAAHLRNPYLRGTLVALAVLAPTASLESVVTAAYVPWFMLLSVFWLLVWRPQTTRGAVLGGLFILLTSLSTPGMWFFAPLAALRLLAIRDRRDGILAGSWVLGSAVQLLAYLAQDEKQVEPLWSHDIWTAFLQRVLDGAALGERVGGKAWELLGWALLIALLLLAVAALVAGLRRADAGTRWLALLAVPIAVLMFVVSVYQRAVGQLMMWPPDTHFGDAGRYTIVPALLLVSVALVLVEANSRRRPALAPWLAGAVVTVLLLGLVSSFDVSNGASRGTPSWSDSLDAAEASCEAEGGESVLVPISEPFSLTVRCDEVLGS